MRPVYLTLVLLTQKHNIDHAIFRYTIDVIDIHYFLSIARIP